MMHLKNLVFLMAFINFLFFLGFGDTSLKGSFYNFYTFEKVNNVIMEINTSPKMRVIITNGYYYLNLTPSCYEIKVYTILNNAPYYSQETICLKNNTEIEYDFILFPAQERKELLEYLDEIDINYNNRTYVSKYLWFFLIVVATIPLMALSYIYFHTKKRDSDYENDEYMKALIDFLKKEKRTTQKEINKALPFSEGKISLMLAELEDKGLIKKIKKGRTNIIYWKGD